MCICSTAGDFIALTNAGVKCAAAHDTMITDCAEQFYFAGAMRCKACDAGFTLGYNTTHTTGTISATEMICIANANVNLTISMGGRDFATTCADLAPDGITDCTSCSLQTYTGGSSPRRNL